MTELADFCRLIACAFAALTVGLFLWTLFWSLFIIFVGGGPISRECSKVKIFFLTGAPWPSPHFKLARRVFMIALSNSSPFDRLAHIYRV